MHYGKDTYAKEIDQFTILPKRDPRTGFIPEIGQRRQLSLGDIRQTLKMYSCASMEEVEFIQEFSLRCIKPACGLSLSTIVRSMLSLSFLHFPFLSFLSHVSLNNFY